MYYRDTYAKIDCDAISHNIEVISKKTNQSLIAVLKANGYVIPETNGYISLGSSNYLWENLFLSNVISDGKSNYGLLIPNTTSWTDHKTFATTDQIPTVNNPTITITQGGVVKGSFTLNQSSGDTIGGTFSLSSYTTHSSFGR